MDVVSESMLAEFISAVPQTHALVLITYRPEYYGTLAQTRWDDDLAMAA